MSSEIAKIVFSQMALIVGGTVGIGFGMMQQTARQRYEKLQQTGALRNEWVVVSGSSRRVAALLFILTLAQAAIPRFFTGGIQWWFTGGLLAGYGVSLFQQFRRRRAGGACR